MLCRRLWDDLGLEDIRLEINSIGDAAERLRHRADLIAYFEAHDDLLDAEAKRRLHTNPLRILDTKNPAMQDLVNARAEAAATTSASESLAHFDGVKRILDHNNIPYTVNPRLVRGIDYYNRTVFEWVTDALGAQGTVCAGGRYDPLIEMFGGKPTPARRLRDGHRAPDRADEGGRASRTRRAVRRLPGAPGRGGPAAGLRAGRAPARRRPGRGAALRDGGRRGQLQVADEKGRRQRRRVRRDPRRRRGGQRHGGGQVDARGGRRGASSKPASPFDEVVEYLVDQIIGAATSTTTITSTCITILINHHYIKTMTTGRPWHTISKNRNRSPP